MKSGGLDRPRQKPGRQPRQPVDKPGPRHEQGRLELPLGCVLSALYVLLLVTLSVVGTLVYSQQESFLVQDLAARLEGEADRSISLPAAADRSASRDEAADGNAQGSLSASPVIKNLVQGLSGPEVTVAVRDSAPAVDLLGAAQVAAALPSDGPLELIVNRDDGSQQVVELMALSLVASAPDDEAPDATPLLLEQSVSLAAVDAALARRGIYLLLGIVSGTLGGVVPGLVFTRALLRPLERIAVTAEAIAGGDFEHRLLLPGGKNEVARRGKTFDLMVDRLVNTLAAQRRFIADASHELRTPLTALKGLTEILMIGAHGNEGRVVEQPAAAINSGLTRRGRLRQRPAGALAPRQLRHGRSAGRGADGL